MKNYKLVFRFKFDLRICIKRISGINLRKSDLKFPLMSYPPQIKGLSSKSRPPMATSIKLGNLCIFSQVNPKNIRIRNLTSKPEWSK